MEGTGPMESAVLTPEMSEFVSLAADMVVPVLLTGESGSGKTFLARLIHQRSDRRNGPLENLACGALPESLIVRELFGHEEGAFTGSGRGAGGIVQAARGGTLVLNELDAVPVGQQAVLLDLVETRRVRRVGRPAGEKVDVRIIATTNVDIRESIAGRLLRADLIQRLSRLSFRVPPLRERLEYLPGLVELLLPKVWAEIVRNGSTCPVLSPPALATLESYPWPGNVRELETVLGRLAMGAARNDARRIGAQAARAVMDPLVEALGTRGGEGDPQPVRSGSGSRYRAPKDPAEERRRIEEALQLAGGNQTEAARILKMSRTTLWQRITRYGLGPQGGEGSGSAG